MSAIIEESLPTCPQCGFVDLQAMPTDACLWFHECCWCNSLLKPEPGDCCVLCSFGSVSCLPSQLRNSGSTGSSRFGTA